MATAQTRNKSTGKALAGLANALAESHGLSPAAAQSMARTMLSNPNVSIGAGGSVHWRGRPFTYQAFADSPFSNLVRGVTAAEQNKAAILGESGYMGDLANLDLQRSLDTAGLDDQRRQAVIDFGDKGFAGADQTLGNEAAVNPFSIIKGIALQDEARRRTAAQSSNLAGTYQGGGLQSGINEAQRQYASQTTDATRTLTDLLSGIAQRQGQAEQVHALGQAQAEQAATQRLLAAGGLHATSFNPTWNTGQFHWWAPPGTGGAGQHPPAPGGHRPPPPPNWHGTTDGAHFPHPPAPPLLHHHGPPRAPGPPRFTY